MIVAGRVIVPVGFDPRESTVRVARMDVRDFHENHHYIERYLGASREIWSSVFEVQPDLEGHFEFEGIPTGSSVDLVAEAPGLSRRGFQSGSPIELRSIVFRLVPEVEIRGTLRYSDTGEIASGVPLVLSAQEVEALAAF